MKLVDSKDPILRTPPKRFDFNDPPMDPKQLADDLKEAMVEFRGVGLSANSPSSMASTPIGNSFLK